VYSRSFSTSEATLVVWKLDRLGRGLKQLIALTEDLGTRKIHFRSLTDSIYTRTTTGRFFFHVMASLAETWIFTELSPPN
jgi:DNA invertase Pin-like site-specific DNA recombinase